MKKSLQTVLAFCVVLLIHSTVQAGEYYVSKKGNDANDGRTKTTAFLTIQKGVDALQPGDTLTIGPGEYFENVKRDNLGNDAVDTVIRAEIPGTTLLRGDVPAPQFKRFKDFKFVYAAPFDQKPFGVLEHDSLLILHERPNISELEFEPGFFYYDKADKMLYISRADLRSPEGRPYTIAVTGKNGMDLKWPKRVVIDGLAATGFSPEWGICLSEPYSCVVRNCTLFMNVGGVVMGAAVEGVGANGGANNIVENCVCYGNSFGGVVRYYGNNDIVRNCYMYKNVREGSEHFGVMHYHDMYGPFLIQNIISWGHSFDFSVKPGPQQETLQNCVGLDHIRIAPSSMVHCLFDGSNEYGGRSDASDDNIIYRGIRDLNWDTEFADSENLDFRLQPDSQFRGAASDKSDRGPYQYEANIFYVSPTGDDAADGLSSRTPWRTLARAVTGLRPGDTLYLSEGEYEAMTWSTPAGTEKPINVHGRGRGTVTISGPMAVTGETGIVFERLTFAGTVALNGAAGITFNNCVFSGADAALSAESVKGLRLTHDIFTTGSLSLKGSSDIFLSGNIYANAGKPAVQMDAEDGILYSDYNSYADAGNCWQVDGSNLVLTDVQQRHDIYSFVCKPALVRDENGLSLKNKIEFVGRGPNGTTAGVYIEYARDGGAPTLQGPFLHSVSDTTANIEWWSASSGTYSLAWGETPEMSEKTDYYGPGRFNSFSLRGLKPNQQYYFKIVSPSTDDKVLSFKTDAAPAEPRVFYVAPDGNDDNDGLSREKAFLTANRAAALVGPGDTVMVAGGEYLETVRLRSTPTEDRPITFRSMPNEQPVFRGEYLSKSFEAIMKPNHRFDGLCFQGWDMFSQGFVLDQSPRTQFTRCMNISVTANNSPDLLIRNCTINGYWNALGLGNCPNTLIENNVFISTILRHISTSSPSIARNNIFCECTRSKTHQTLLDVDLNAVKESNNCFYLRWPVEEKLTFNEVPLPVYRAKTGSDAFSANPMMAGMPGQLLGYQLVDDEDISLFFTANPELILRGIGLQPEAFVDLGFGGADWPYTRAWAEQITEKLDAADALAKAGKNSKALSAYLKIAQKLPMPVRLQSDVMEKASRCAERLKKFDRALELAKAIPIEPLAIKRQMEIMLAGRQYSALLNSFAEDKLGGRKFINAFAYPDLEDVKGDLYYYRSIAYCETGDLAAAETDLKAMNAYRFDAGYRSGEAIHDLNSLRLGDFYRKYMKDDAKALAAYMEVCNRQTWSPFGTTDKPPSTGASKTLVSATEAACKILAEQGKTEEVEKLKASLTEAQQKAAAELQK